jgi:trans-2-enoyl-CoA reductase
MQKEFKVLKGQTLADIAIQETGHLEGIYDLAIRNGISMTEILRADQVLVVDDSDRNMRLYTRIKSENIKPATEFNMWTEEVPELSGIGYWAIGIDFTIS